MLSCPFGKKRPFSRFLIAPTFSPPNRSPHQLKITRAVAPSKKTPLHPLPPPSNRIFVGGIPTQTSEAELLGYFSPFGRIREVTFPSNGSSPGGNRGFAFLTYETLDDATKVVAVRHPHIIRAKVVRSAAGCAVRR